MRSAVSRILDHLKDDGGLQGKDIANIVAVSPATVSRWSSGKATPDLKTQTVIAELRYVVDRLADFYTPEETRLWLHAGHPMLGGARPIDLINGGRTAEVLAVIEALDSGAYTQAPDLPRLARDLQLLDAIDAFRREPLDAEVWRVVRDGRDPVLGSPSLSRWCDGTFDVLYTSLDRDGAIAEIHALLSLQPVFPSKMQWFAHKLRISAAQTLKLADLPTLARLGVDVERYAARDYSRTQPIAEAANFLGFDGLIAPSARWSCLNLVLFTERLAPSQIETVGREEHPIAWDGWRKRPRR